ncbi:TM2 domain protein [Marinomonas aquimarina]|uniref:TM2 domain protein n=1 Tax=Marinomonas aquimarina TaxID=295068 RepID=A0A1A8TBD0_9GAMM|nr:TM2 domain-containing protein [Marinomonas aquimarina]SBS29105.1 TM2 domain protein [Marinomonas aquimarina]
MKGNILEFNETSRIAVISGADGNRYNMEISEWKGSSLPKSGMDVDFTGSETNASAVYPQSSASSGEKRIPAAILAFFLGTFGVHKFYLGYKKQGLIMLLVAIFGIILAGIPTLVIGIIAFVEFIIYLLKSNEEFDRTYVEGQKGWF